MRTKIRGLFPRADDFTTWGLVLNTVVDTIHPVGLGTCEVGRVGVLVDTINGIVHAVEAIATVGGGQVSAGTIPGELVAVYPYGIRAPVRGTGSIGSIVCLTAECNQAVGSNTELVLPDTKEIEGVWDGCVRAGEDVVGADAHTGAKGEGRVRRVVGDLVDSICSVEVLHGDVGHTGEDYTFACVAVDDGVPTVVTVLGFGSVVVFLFDLHLGTGRLHGRPLVLAAIDGCTRGGLAENRTSAEKE